MTWLKKQVNKSENFDQAIAVGIAIGIVLGIAINIYQTSSVVMVERVYAEEAEVVAPVEVLVEVVYTEEDIIRKIKEAFPEEPNTAVAIAKCESGLVPDIQSQHTLSYGQERSYGLFQIHSPVWHYRAIELGYEDYRTSVDDNIAMARYIYDSVGKKWTPWSCYTKK